MFNILHSIVLHLPVHLQSLNLRQKVPALFEQQFLVEFSFSIRDRVVIHRWAMCIANEKDALLEIRQESSIM